MEFSSQAQEGKNSKWQTLRSSDHNQISVYNQKVDHGRGASQRDPKIASTIRKGCDFAVLIWPLTRNLEFEWHLS